MWIYVFLTLVSATAVLEAAGSYSSQLNNNNNQLSTANKQCSTDPEDPCKAGKTITITIRHCGLFCVLVPCLETD